MERRNIDDHEYMTDELVGHLQCNCALESTERRANAIVHNG